MAWPSPSTEGVIATLALLGSTAMAILGVITGQQAVTLYGIILGYVFGVEAGRGRPNHHNGREDR